MTEVLEKPQAKPSGPGTVKPMVRHIIERIKKEGASDDDFHRFDGQPFGDKTLCGKLWDRLLAPSQDICPECKAELLRRYGQ